MYKDASLRKLRFQTSLGNLSVEQLWDLSEKQLANSIMSVSKLLNKNNDDELNFLDSNNVIDTENELRFNILKDVYLTKKKEKEQKRDEAQNKEFNSRIDQLIFEKKEQELRNLTVDELEKLRR